MGRAKESTQRRAEARSVIDTLDAVRVLSGIDIAEDLFMIQITTSTTQSIYVAGYTSKY